MVLECMYSRFDLALWVLLSKLQLLSVGYPRFVCSSNGTVTYSLRLFFITGWFRKNRHDLK